MRSQAVIISIILLLTHVSASALAQYHPRISSRTNGGIVPSPTDSSPRINTGQPYAVGAWYFTAWSVLNDFHAVNSGNLYGRTDVWGGVRDHALGKDPWNLGVNYSSREPLIGFYDLTDQQIMDMHILQAASRGLSYFAFYWYWDKDKNSESGVGIPIRKIISSPVKDRIKFLVAPIMLRSKGMTLDMWKNNVVPYMVDNYVLDSSYLKTEDGRPIIVDFDTGFLVEADHRQALDFLREHIKGKTGKDPVILFVAQEVHTSGDLGYAKEHLNLDGFVCFAPSAPLRPGEKYSDTMSRIIPTFERQGQSFYVPCASTGYDPRPWWRIGYGWDVQPNQMIHNVDITPEAFENHLRELKKYIDNNPVKTSKMLTVYAWNEWGEGGIIEPSFVYKYRYLDMIRSVFGLVPTAEEPKLSSNRAIFTDLSVPREMKTGRKATVSVTMKNRGETTWTQSEGYKLGSQNPQDNTVWGLNRVDLDSSDAIAPGQSKTFSFTITAPSASGTYSFRWRMVKEFVEWFGDYTPNAQINVIFSPLESTTTITISATASFTSTATISVTETVIRTQTFTTTDIIRIGDYTWVAIGALGGIAVGALVSYAIKLKKKVV